MPRGSHSSIEDPAPLLDQAANAFDEGRFEDVVSLAEQALQLDARSAPARHFRAAGLLEAGRGDEALQEYERALRLAPSDPEILLGMADLLICRPGEDRALVERGLALCDKGRKLARKADDPDLEFEFLLLEGTARNQLGESAEAIEVLDEALAIVPESADAALERAIALFELCRLDEAHRGLRKVIQEAPDEPWAHHYLGL